MSCTATSHQGAFHMFKHARYFEKGRHTHLLWSSTPSVSVFLQNFELWHSESVEGTLTRTTADLTIVVHHSPPGQSENSLLSASLGAFNGLGGRSINRPDKQSDISGQSRTHTGCQAPLVARRQKNPGSWHRRLSPQRIMSALYCSL